MRPNLFVAFAALLLAAAACTSVAPESTLDPTVANALAPACSHQAVAEAGALITDDHAPNHLVVLGDADAPIDWTRLTPTAWTPPNPGDAEIVVCVGERTDTQIEVCPFYGGDIFRYASSWAMTAVEAITGRTIATFDMTAMPRQCNTREDASLDELRGVVTADILYSHLVGLVEHGRYIPPTTATPPATASPGVTAEVTPAGRMVTLGQALRDDLVTVAGTGDGLSRLEIELESKVATDLTVTVEAGTLFDPAARGTQTMVVLWDVQVELAAHETADELLDVACVEMHKDQPTNDDGFSISGDVPSADLVALLAEPELQDVSGRVRQFAVWTITNNPRRNAYVPLGTQFEVFGTGPDEEEIAEIRTLFEAAGIDIDKYRALR